MVRPPYIENAMLAEHWNSVTIWLSVTGRPCPPYSAGADKTEPAALGDLLERFLEAFRRGDAAVGIVLAAFEIADAIERLQHLFGKLGSFAQDRLAHVGGGIGEAGQIVVAVDLEDVVEQEVHVFHGGLVDRHGSLPAGRM